jgi:hypothetical protein
MGASHFAEPGDSSLKRKLIKRLVREPWFAFPMRTPGEKKCSRIAQSNPDPSD